VADLTLLPPEKIVIHTTYLGGGFGRRIETDFIKQAVLLSKAVKQPVKVVWSREEDIQQDVYRPATLAKLTAALDENGMPIALKSRIVNSSIFKRFAPDQAKGDIDPISVEGFNELSYEIPNQSVEYVMKNTHVPVGFWRSVGHSHNAFFIESFIDELAHAAGKEPYQFRHALLSKQPRSLKVLETLVEKAAWGKPAPQRQYRGMALHHSFGSIVGEVVEVSIDKADEVKVHKVVCVVDCGIVVNPDTVVAQMESGIIYGLSALKEAITIKEGHVQQSNFHDFPILKLADAPLIEVHLISSEEAPGGVGEPATPPILPAVMNAVFAATGKRIRQLPLSSELLKA
jgi:isoquinoline 1-oxidoreductase beta subunit